MLAKATTRCQVQLMTNNVRYFGVMPKLAKMEVTVRTPYKTLFENCNTFSRMTVNTIKGNMTISNKTWPRVYLLPPGELLIANCPPGEAGNFTKSESGKFMHTGGWLHVHDNNTVEINVLECCEKEQFNFDKIDSVTSETDSPAGKVAAQLQDRTFKIFQRRRA